VATTVTLESERQAGEPSDARLIVFEGARPLEAPSRHLLRGVDEVTVGRGDRRRATRTRAGLEERLAIELPDDAISSQHLRLVRVRGQHVATDLRSKNGVYLNGSRTARAVLVDGDAIACGRAVLVYRAAGTIAQPEALDLDGAYVERPAPGLETFVGSLAVSYEELRRVAPGRVTVLVLGETGTGKEVVARSLHALSGRAGAFIPVNCGAIPSELFESSIFGHRRGAFSGAVEDRPGLARAADRGTLFLDEIGDLALPSQTALLRVLQENEVVPVGDTRPVAIDLRVVAATHRDLEAAVQAGTFRADLFARLGGLTIRLPRLADRREDLGFAIAAILRRLGARDPGFTAEAARAIFRHSWPLNIRELEKALGLAVSLAGRAPISLADLRLPLPPAPPTPVATDAPSSDDGGDERLRKELVALLEEHRGNLSAVARAMGKGRMQIHRWLRRWGLDPASYR
jgi:transcriptional regulator of acetoin/glycerol metabolism